MACGPERSFRFSSSPDPGLQRVTTQRIVAGLCLQPPIRFLRAFELAGLSNRVPMRLAKPHAMEDIAGIVGVGGRTVSPVMSRILRRRRFVP